MLTAEKLAEDLDRTMGNLRLAREAYEVNPNEYTMSQWDEARRQLASSLHDLKQWTHEL